LEKFPFSIFSQKIYIALLRNIYMVVRMSWMHSVPKLITVMMIFCLLGSLTQACHDYEEEEKYYKEECYEEEKEDVIVEEKVEPQEESGSDITQSKWFIILDKLIDRYPIIERIIERIFQWIFNNLLDMDY
jgi:hypothetical protein